MNYIFNSQSYAKKRVVIFYLALYQSFIKFAFDIEKVESMKFQRLINSAL
jgi:hypothetical protein